MPNDEYYSHQRVDVMELVPPDARCIIDVGCGAGALGESIKKARPEVSVRGIEIIARQAERARHVLDDAVAASAEEPLPASWPAPDCVIFADVLEHLFDPWVTLRLWYDRIAPGGALVVSLPNTGNAGIVLGLLRGRWDYGELGLLDRTHLRFFTRKTAIDLIESAGFRIERFIRAFEPLHGGVSSRRLQQLSITAYRREQQGKYLPGPLRTLVDLYTYEFLIVARRTDAGEPART